MGKTDAAIVIIATWNWRHGQGGRFVQTIRDQQSGPRNLVEGI